MLAVLKISRPLFRLQPGASPRSVAGALLDWLQPLWVASADNQLPPLIGLAGAQGSGKTTLSKALVVQAAERGIDVLTLSLDDFYFGRARRQRLARELHPLFATRGVPGTHDLALLDDVLGTLAAGAEGWRGLRLPRFDKGRDTRLPPSRWRHLQCPPQLIVLEGWCVGTPPQDAAALVEPINTLEREEDPAGVWRRAVNRALVDYQALWHRLDRLVMLRAPSWQAVARWRAQPEQALLARGAPQAMDAMALKRFLMHYERLTRHALACVPERADLLLQLDAQRRIVRVTQRRH
jgi:Predicted kinase